MQQASLPEVIEPLVLQSWVAQPAVWEPAAVMLLVFGGVALAAARRLIKQKA